MTLIYFILILGIVVLVHEFGHFIFAKKSGVYVYEFSIGMGPRLFKWTRKNDETEYSLRLLPIGGYCQLAGEEIDDDESVPKDKKIAKKTFGQKMMIAFAGIMNNFILAIILLFLIAIFNGAPQNKALVGEISEGFPAYTSGLQEGDEILTINGRDASSNDLLALELQVNVGKTIDMEVERNGEVLEFTIEPKKVKMDGEETYKYGFVINDEVKHGLWASIVYAFTKFLSLLWQMVLMVFYLCTGQLGLSSLAGPVGIFSVVGSAAAGGIWSLVSFTALISINVGFINLLPIPAFDGGRIFFLIAEKIKGRPVDPKFENMVHAIGFFLLMLLMILITYNDILRLL